jgi:hypothetical protein
MSSSLSKRAINRQRWRERIRACEKSGLTQKAFCEQHHLGLASLQRWRRLLKTEEPCSNPAPVALLPVRVKEMHPSNLTVVVSNDLRIEIPADFDPNALRQVIEVLRAV